MKNRAMEPVNTVKIFSVHINMKQSQNHRSCNITIDTQSFGKVSQLKCPEETLTNRNEVHDVIRTINSAKACYHAFYLKHSEAEYTI
jgi:hypothetical protein